jgi:hypothetical protein
MPEEGSILEEKMPEENLNPLLHKCYMLDQKLYYLRYFA